MAAAERDPPCPPEVGEGPSPSPSPSPPPSPRGGEGPVRPPGPSPARRVTPGVLYLPALPPGFGPRHARALLAPHGELGRVFLQPRGGGSRRRRGRAGPFAEGWVEFRDKRAAKRAAALLHGAPMGARGPLGERRWSLRYLPGFRWPHLSERLGYERQVRAQRLRAEAAQVRREGRFREAAPPPSRPSPTPSHPPPPAPPPAWRFAQRATDPERWGRRPAPPPGPSPRLLRMIFGGGKGGPSPT